MLGANEFANLAGPKARQRFVIPVVFRIGRAHRGVVVQYAGLHDRSEASLSSNAKLAALVPGLLESGFSGRVECASIGSPKMNQ